MNETEIPRRKRRRPALSCVQCRRRKIKCDRNAPCNNCVQAKVASACCYSSFEPQTTTPAATELLSSRGTSLAGPDAGQTWSRDFSSSRTVTSNESPQYARSSNGQDSVRQAPTPDSGIDELRNRVRELEELLSEKGSTRVPAVSHALLSRKPAVEAHGSMSKTRFFGEGHWMNTLRQFDRLDSFIQRAEQNPKRCKEDFQSAEILGLLDKCKAMARTAKAERPLKSFMPPDFRSYIPVREVSDQLVGLYLRTFESTHRILHVPSFQAEYARYWEDPQNAASDFVMKLLLVMAIGVCFYQNEKDETVMRSLASQWVYTAQLWLNSPSEKSRLNISGLQVHCLLLVARQINSLGSDFIWISAGSLLRLAFNMGLHRDPRHFPHISVFASEIRRRLWATILELAVQSSVDSGMPPLISYDDFDCELPSNIDDIEIAEATKAPPFSKPLGHFTQTLIQIILMKSLRLRLEVARMINDFRTDPSYDEVLKLSADITQTLRESVAVMQAYPSISGAQYDHGPTKFHKRLVSALTRRFLILLHRPFALKARTDPRYFFSRKVCLDTAMLLVTTLEDPFPSTTLQDDFCRLALIGDGVFQDTLFHEAAITICLELVIQLEEEAENAYDNPMTRPQSITQMSRSTREPLVQAIERLIELSGHRVALGETNVKTHLFLSTALGQIRAMEAGTPIEDGIFESAKQSLNICFALLLARTSSIPVGLGQSSEPSQQEMMGQNFADDLFMQANLNFNIPSSWLFSTWEDNDSWM